MPYPRKPAAYYAKVPSRKQYYDIAVQGLTGTTLDYLAGSAYLTPDGDGSQENLFDIAAANGWVLANTNEDIRALNAQSGRVLAIDPNIADAESLNYEIDRERKNAAGEDVLALADYVKAGINVLDSDEGFFLMCEGVSPIAAAFVTVTALTVMIDLLVGGLTRKTLIAVLGSLAGTLITGILSIVLTDSLKLDGGDIPYLVPLLSQSFMTLDAKALYCGMIFIANSGALMDLSMDIAASCLEIVHHKPDVPRRELMRSGMTIGRSVLGTMTTTLMLAYSGNYLSMLMYFMGQGTPVIDIINLKYVASQLLSTLVGSFGLVAAAPLTALIASALCVPKAGRAKA